MAKSLLNKNGKAKDRVKGASAADNSTLKADRRVARRTKRSERREARKAGFEDMFGNIGMDTGYDDATGPETGADPFMADYGYESPFGDTDPFTSYMPQQDYSTVAGTNAPASATADPYSTSTQAGTSQSLLGQTPAPAAPVAPVAPTAPTAPGAPFPNPYGGGNGSPKITPEQAAGMTPSTGRTMAPQGQEWTPGGPASPQAMQAAMGGWDGQGMPPMAYGDIQAKMQQMQQAQAAMGPGAPSLNGNPEYLALKRQMSSYRNPKTLYGGDGTLEQKQAANQYAQARNALQKPQNEAFRAMNDYYGSGESKLASTWNNPNKPNPYPDAAIKPAKPMSDFMPDYNTAQYQTQQQNSMKGAMGSLYGGSQPSLLGNTQPTQPGTGGTMQANYGMQQPSQPSLLGGGANGMQPPRTARPRTGQPGGMRPVNHSTGY